MIVLVGRNMGTASGVVKEITFATRNNVPYFGVYVDKADSSSILPSGFQSIALADELVHFQGLFDEIFDFLPGYIRDEAVLGNPVCAVTNRARPDNCGQSGKVHSAPSRKIKRFQKYNRTQAKKSHAHDFSKSIIGEKK